MKFMLLAFVSIGILGTAVFSQVKTVTNADLEKYRLQRIKAAEEYRRNYSAMGFPSPEELERSLEKSRIEREALAARFADEELRRERFDAEKPVVVNVTSSQYRIEPVVPRNYILGYPESRFWRHNRRVRIPFHTGPHWRNRFPTTTVRYPQSIFIP